MRHIIPVLDIQEGLVVQAAGGDRARYAPIRSTLTRSAVPGPVVEDLLRAASFAKVYLADLDAIMGKTSQHRLIVELCHQHPQVEFWVDAGPPPDSNQDVPANFRPVIGTEFAAQWRQEFDPGILSLDFDADGLRGGADVWKHPECWPVRVIIMCLHRVGSMAGPDRERLLQVRELRPDCEFAAAGGVRNAAEARALLDEGFDVLAASMLHQGRIPAQELRELVDRAS